MKECEIVTIMGEGYANHYSKMLDAIVSTINNKLYDMIKLEVVKSKMDEIFEALELKVRYDHLNSEADGKLMCNRTCFELNGHKFETLDEVAKALENKAFL
jgi:hypothetical protein